MTPSLDPARVERLIALADGEVAAGRLPSCQLALAIDGEVVVRHTAGAADDAVYAIFSATKALTAALAWMYLAPETLVVDLIPEFAGGGKEQVTLEHLLTHTAGFPRAPMTAEQGSRRDTRRAKMATWRLDTEPGTQMEYHPSSAHWVVGDMIEVVAGQPLVEVMRDRLLEPLGLPSLRFGLGSDDHPVEAAVAVGSAGETASPAAIPVEHLLRFNDSATRAVGVPGAGAVSTADDLALLYQHLLHDPKGLWDDAVLADGTGHVRCRLIDPWTGVPALRTLGLTVAGDDGKAPLRQFGKATGPRAFGAIGAGGQIAFADPDSGLSFSFLTNGLQLDQIEMFVRTNRLATAAARCVQGAST